MNTPVARSQLSPMYFNVSVRSSFSESQPGQLSTRRHWRWSFLWSLWVTWRILPCWMRTYTVQSVITPIAYAITLSTSCIANSHRWHVLPLLFTDAAISYLWAIIWTIDHLPMLMPISWLTSFIFLALDFNHVSCSVHRWNGEVVCSRKYAAEAFSFIAL
jgi:hypothetical protein